MTDKTIKIAYLYEDLMNTYGDLGDVKVIRCLLDKQGHQAKVDDISLDDKFDTNDYDFLFLGDGQDFEQTVVAKDLPRHKETTENYVNAGNPMLCICDGYQSMGDYYKTNFGITIKGLGILSPHIIFKADKWMIGDTCYMTEWGEIRVFEDHSGQTYFDNINMLHPFGEMIGGYGNNPQDRAEGLRYKNFIGSYSHGPLLRNTNVANATVKITLKHHEERTANEVESV